MVSPAVGSWPWPLVVNPAPLPLAPAADLFQTGRLHLRLLLYMPLGCDESMFKGKPHQFGATVGTSFAE
jgi:hypothetical protein